MDHEIGAIEALNGHTPRNLAIYFYKPDEDGGMSEAECRLESFQDLDPELLQALQEMLDDNNSYIQTFRSVRDMIRTGDASNVKLVIHANKKPNDEHTRRYNAPESG